MCKKIVKYHNSVNKIPLRNLTEKEINIFFSLIFKAKDKGNESIEMSFKELRGLSKGDINNPRFIKAIQSMEDKLIKLNQRIEVSEGEYEVFTFFNRFSLNTKNKTLKIQVNEFFIGMLNNLKNGNFTLLELKQLVDLKSSYSKNAYRLMKQWESAKKFDIDIEEFKRILCIPETYRMKNIDQRVLNPIMEELSPIFPNLKLEKIKNGRKITDLKFTWSRKSMPKNRECLPLGVTKVLEISEGLNKAIEKAKKNRFIEPLMSEGNIKKLFDIYGDHQLTKGLYFASSEINKKIDSINYVIKTINTGIEEKDIKIVVKKSKSNDLQGVEPKGEVKEKLTEEIREPEKELIKKSRKEVILQSKKEGLSLKITNITLKGLGCEEVTQEEFNEVESD